MRRKAFPFFRHTHKSIVPTRIIALSFAGIILLGACLLTLPIASRSGQSQGFLSALFTATSATCVTGLAVGDTYTLWSGFGQGVILCLIELGGLGFMSVASALLFLFRRKFGLRQRMVIAQTLSLNDMADVVKLQKWVIFGSLSVQLFGALILTLRLTPQFGFGQSVLWGIFHAVSAFCNAGFDIFGKLAPGASVAVFQNDPVILITLMFLILIGGLGFFVWEEIAHLRSFRKFSVYTRLVLIASAVLVVGGAALIAALEWQNPGTMGSMSTGSKILNSFFQAVTTRTAGFASVDQAQLTDGGKAVSMLLMFVGGASGSTAGGAKIVTIVVLFLFLWTRARGRSTVCLFKRTIPAEKVLDALTIVFIMLILALFGGIFITASCPVSFTDALFESISALATTGLTAGVTDKLTVAAKVLVILYMYFGRVGVLTISLGFLLSDKSEDRFQYAHTNLLIG